jgi:hypothetical protein
MGENALLIFSYSKNIEVFFLILNLNINLCIAKETKLLSVLK